MKKSLMLWMALALCLTAFAEDGSQLWLRYEKVGTARITGHEQSLAAEELRNYYKGAEVTLVTDPSMADEAYRISGQTITAKTEVGLLYGAFALLRGEQGYSAPVFKMRILNLINHLIFSHQFHSSAIGRQFEIGMQFLS